MLVHSFSSLKVPINNRRRYISKKTLTLGMVKQGLLTIHQDFQQHLYKLSPKYTYIYMKGSVYVDVARGSYKAM